MEVRRCLLISLLSARYEENGVLIGKVWTGLSLAVIMMLSVSIIASRRKHEEAKGILSYRVVDRRGDHSDHRGHRNSEPAPVSYGRERGFGSRFTSHH